jgi:hypothetical protein
VEGSLDLDGRFGAGLEDSFQDSPTWLHIELCPFPWRRICLLDSVEVEGIRGHGSLSFRWADGFSSWLGTRGRARREVHVHFRIPDVN